jgi:hypothetical protein
MWLLEDLGDGFAGDFKSVADEQSLRSELMRLASMEPRVVFVALSDNEYVHIGIGGAWAFVEHVIDEPWKCQHAVSNGAELKPEFVSFIAGGQDSEIPSEALLPIAEAIELLTQFFQQNAVPTSWQWELT